MGTGGPGRENERFDGGGQERGGGLEGYRVESYFGPRTGHRRVEDMGIPETPVTGDESRTVTT